MTGRLLPACHVSATGLGAGATVSGTAAGAGPTRKKATRSSTRAWNRSKQRWITGVTYRVISWETIKPPTITSPSGRREAPSAPKPTAMGSAGDGGERRHEDWPEAREAGLEDGAVGRFAGVNALAREVRRS